MINLEQHIVNTDIMLIEALEKLNRIPDNLTLFVIDKDKRLAGTITDGDIRRGLIKGVPVDSKIERFMSTGFAAIKGSRFNFEEIKKIKERGVKLLPVLDDDGCIKSVIDFRKTLTILPVNAFLMAGGRGERLMPMTARTPKPLLKLGKKPIIDHIINGLKRYGITDYIISVRYLGEMIEKHIGDGTELGIKADYVRELEPLGTIGSLSLVNRFNQETILLMNADILTNIDYEDFYQKFVDSEADMAIASVPFNVDIPYAILQEDNEHIVGLKEKPRHSYHANAGIYLIKKSLTDLLIRNEKCDAPDFIQRALDAGKKIVRYPIIGYWIDIGKQDDFIKASEFAAHIKE